MAYRYVLYNAYTKYAFGGSGVRYCGAVGNHCAIVALAFYLVMCRATESCDEINGELNHAQSGRIHFQIVLCLAGGM